MQEEVEIKQLLPLKRADFASLHIPVDAPREELALVPSAEAVMDRIVPDYLVGFVYGALVEAFSCEQNARMMAMENATNSAKDMLHELDILYNQCQTGSYYAGDNGSNSGSEGHRNAKEEIVCETGCRLCCLHKLGKVCKKFRRDLYNLSVER